jgi:molybdopterin-binding protein
MEIKMKLSARNALTGKIVEIKEGAVAASVKIDVNGVIITSSITDEAVKELGLTVGDTVTALIKASDVLIGK